MNLPGYDEWKLTNPYEMTAEQEAAHEAEMDQQEQNLRDAVAAAFSDGRGDLYLSTVRQIVVEELNKLLPLAGEPEWQTKTPVPVPNLG